MITATQLAGLTMNPIAAWIKRRVLKLKINALYSASEYYTDQIANGREGLKWAHKRLVNLESELRDLG